jgi:hypothetical protein
MPANEEIVDACHAEALESFKTFLRGPLVATMMSLIPPTEAAPEILEELLRHTYVSGIAVGQTSILKSFLMKGPKP